MKRRDFITVVASAAAWAAVAHAQEPGRVIGILSSMSNGALLGSEAAFIEGLKASGFLEGRKHKHRMVLGRRSVQPLGIAGERADRP
jgi:hypothetical protein